MSVFTYSVALLLIGLIIAWAFSTGVGIALMGVAVIGMLFSLLRFVESNDNQVNQDDLDRQVDDVLRHHPR